MDKLWLRRNHGLERASDRQGSFDCSCASLREAQPSLRMTKPKGCVSAGGALVGGGDPDALGCGAAEGDVAGCGGQGEGLIIVALEQAQLRSGTNAAGFEKLEQAAVALIDTAHGVSGAGFSVGEQEQAAMAAAGGTLHLTEVAVRTGTGFAEFGQQFGLEIGRDSVFQPFGLIVHLPPLHTEEFGQHALDQMMAEGEFASDFAAGGGEAYVAVGLNANQAVFFQAANRHGDSWGRNFQPVGEASRDHGFSFTFGVEDGLEIVFFGDGDHLWGLYDWRLIAVKFGRNKIFNTEGTGEHRVILSLRGLTAVLVSPNL